MKTITTLLSAKLESKGVKIEKVLILRNLNEEIADYLELTNSFPAQVIRQIRQIQEVVMIQLVWLIPQQYCFVVRSNKKLKDARINFNRCKR